MKQMAVKTRKRTEFVEITDDVQRIVREIGLNHGVATIFVPHTTAGVAINEHADPDVMTDVDHVFDQMVPWTGRYKHAEGNTAAHVKAIMTGSSVQVLVEDGTLQFGTWQGIFFCEFDGPRTRNVWITGAPSSA